MSVLGTVKEILRESTQNPNRGDGATESTGAYWCHECEERIPDGDVDGESAPDCPGCGEAMTFDRSPGSTGCAC